MNLEIMKCDLVLVNINTNERFILHHSVSMYKCGRGKANQVITCSLLASREHCMFFRANGQLNVLDLGSANGVYINGVLQEFRVIAPVKINDIIGLGSPNLVPDDNPSSASPGIYKLLVLETESVADSSQATGDTTAKITSDNKRRHSRDSVESKIPRKISKVEIPDIIDISDDSSDEIIVPKNTDDKSCNKKIIVESNVPPIKSKICENETIDKAKELSRSLQENNSEFSLNAGTFTDLSTDERKEEGDSDRNDNSALNAASSTCLSTNGKKRFVNDKKNVNSSSVAHSSTCSTSDGRKKSVDSEKTANSSKAVESSVILSINERKKSVDTEKNLNSSKAAEPSATSSTNRRKRSEDSDKNVDLPNGTKTNNSVDKKKKSEENATNHCEKPPKVRKVDELQPAASSKKTNSAKPKNSKGKHSENNETTIEKKAPNLPNKKVHSSEQSLESLRLKDQVVPSSEDNESFSVEIGNAKKPQETEKTNEFLEEDEDSNFLVQAFDLDELNLEERINGSKGRGQPDEPNIQTINNGHVDELIKYETELNIIDDDESVYKNLEHLPNENIVPTPIKLKRVRQEIKTRYSEFDVVVLSDDEDGVFPASQLFGDESDGEIEHKVQIKDKQIENIDGDLFENSRDDVSDIIVLSDSDDEDNPWYDRLLRSQLLNESRLSLNNLVKEEPEEENLPFQVPFGDDLEELFADNVAENENVEVADDAEKQIEEEAEENESLFRAQDLLEENNEEFTIKDVKEEIFDLCFTSDSNKTEKSDADKSKRQDKKRKSTENKLSVEEIVLESSQEKQIDKDVEMTERIDENEKTVINKDCKEKTDLENERIEDKSLPADKRTSRKKRLSDRKISLEKQRLWTEKVLAEEKSETNKNSSAEKRSTEEEIGTADKRLSDGKKLTEQKRISVEKRPIEKSSLPKQESAEKISELKKRTSIEKSALHKRKSGEKSVEKSAEKSVEKSAEKAPEVEKRIPIEKSSHPKQKSVEKSAERATEVEKPGPIEKSSLPKQKSAEKTAEIDKIATKDVKSKPKSNKREVEKHRRSSEAKSSNMSDSSNDRSDCSEAKSKDAEPLSGNRQLPKENPIVILTKLDHLAKTVQLVDAPFLTNGTHRGVSCKITTIDRSSDKQGSPIASTSGTNDSEKTATRKLTTKQKKEEALKTRIGKKMQLKEQRHRLQKNKWAAKCMLPNKKPALSPFTPKERKDISNDRKEKLKQIANEKKAAEEIQPSTTRRVVKAKAKVTTNSRNDFLVKELEEQTKQNSTNLERLALENDEKIVENLQEKDKCLESRTENLTEEIYSVRERKSPRGKKTNKDNDEKIREMNGDYLVNKNIREKFLKDAKKVSANSEIDQLLVNSVKAIPKKSIFLGESEVPNNFSEKLAKPNTLKNTLMVNGTTHVFGEQNKKFGQTLTSNTNANVKESSLFVLDPRLTIGKSVLKENCEPNEIKNADKTKTKKRVSFNDLNTRVDFFEIDPGNSLKKCVSKDAPLIVKHFPKSNSANSKACCPKLEQFLLHIFKWNPVWLEEQKQLNAAPPIVDEKKLSPMLSKYASYDDYYKTTEPLLALELWNGITRDYESKVNQKACFKYSIVNHSIVLTTVPSTKIRVTTLMLEVVVSKKDAEKQAHPVYGDLVFFEYISNRKSKEGCQRWKVFAYVTNVRQTVITPLTHFNRDLLTFEKDSHTLLTYTVVTKPLDASDIQTNKVSRLRTISYLRSNIRMIQALQNLPVSALCNTILHPKVEDYQLPVVANLDTYPLVTKDKLNRRQLEAVARITEAAVQRLPRVCLIQGPPGTGKSRVIVNLVTQILYGNGRYQSNKKLRILVCAPSNAAIDEIVLRLLDIRRTFQKGNRFNMVRIGRIESMHPQVKEVSVTELAGRDVRKTADTYMSPTFTSDSVEEEKRFLQARMNALELEKSNTTSFQNPLYQKQILRKLADIHAKYNLLMNRKPASRLNDREKLRLLRAAENTLLKGADVITCTLTSCYTNQMESIFGGKESISVCIVDEATQSSEAETLIPLMLGVKTLVLVGDTNQLPATVLSQKAKQFGLEQSLFARIQNVFDGQKKDPIILLNTQYRMSTPVAWWPNRYFYAGALKNDAVKYPFPFHCYKIMDLDSTQNEDKFSNTEEASFVAKVVYTLMTRSKLDHLKGPVTIGVITPYNNQKQLVIQKIRERMANVSEKVKKKIVHEVNTVDSFQGQERDVIIMSCVRSNGIGFLSDRQRLCVALTRAKHSLFLCGNFRTFKRDPMWNALLTDAFDRGAYVTIKAKAETDEIKQHTVR